MPYHIEKFKKGFRAVDNKGMALSNKPMTKNKVHKQIIAVFLSKMKKKGLKSARKEIFGGK